MKLPADPKLPIFGGADYARSLYQRLYALFRQITMAVNANADDISARATVTEAPWLGKVVGEPFGLRDDLAGVPVPPTDNSLYRFIRLTAADPYNTGVLTSESVSGSAPLVVATAVISLAASPLNGRTVNLWNTERRFARAGAAGTLADDALQTHGHTINIGTTTSGPSGAGYVPFGPSANTGSYGTINTGGGRTANETRPRNQGVTYYMRIL